MIPVPIRFVESTWRRRQVLPPQLAELLDDVVATVKGIKPVASDEGEQVTWLDRDMVQLRLGIELAPEEAETAIYIAVRLLLERLGELCTDTQFDEILAASVDGTLGEHRDLGLLQLAAAMHFAAEAPGVRTQQLLAIADNAASRRSDPNIARLKLRLEDQLLGTHRLDRIREHLAERRCTVPFRRMETSNRFGVFLCCSAWLPVSVADWRRDETAGEAFHGPMAQKVREAIVDGNYRYCNWLSCPKIAGCAIEEGLDADASARELPAEVFLSHDETCNLSCPSCRSELRAASADFARLNESPFMRSMEELLPELEMVKITGSGDPFASKYFRDMLKRLPEGRRNLYLHTNALLLTERSFAEQKLKDKVSILEISIDAARPATYAVVRRGGDFARLRERLAYARSLRESGEVPYLQFDFVVQARNYAEMPEFVDLGREFKADAIFFSKLRNWGSFSPEEFPHHAVCSPLHPDYPRLLEVLKDPRLADPLVNLGDLPRPA